MRRLRRCRFSRTTETRAAAGGGTTDAAGSCGGGEAAALPAKRPRRLVDDDEDWFDRLPDDLVLTVLAGIAAAAASPADVVAASVTCRRFRDLAAHPLVLSRASAAAVAVRACRWSEPAHRFLRRCAGAGSLRACYFLGMVRFYCLGSRATGAALLARAAAGGHAAALYSLAVVQFNGSGGGKADKDPCAGVALCARAAWLGHEPALRELGHCLQDGYGVRRDAAAGRHLLLHAAARELLSWHCRSLHRAHNDTADVEDAASRFMVEWWQAHQNVKSAAREGVGDVTDLRMCSHAQCGRRETRRHEFRWCSVCGSANYCSRVCQALHWRRAHSAQCAAVRWLAAADAH